MVARFPSVALLRLVLLLLLAGSVPSAVVQAQESTRPSRQSLESAAREAYQRDDLNEAIRLYLELSEMGLGPAERSEFLVRVGWLEHLSGRQEQSRSALARALTEYPEYEFRGSLYSDSYVATYREVRAELESSRANRNARLVTESAKALREGRLDEAESILNRILSSTPNDPHALYNRALVASARGEMTASLEYFERIVALSSRGDVPRTLQALALAGLGRVHLRAGNFSDAETSLTQALRIDPANTEALTTLAAAYAAEGELEQALASYQRAEEAGSRPLLFERAQILQQLERYGEAAQLLLDEAASNPSPEVFGLLAWTQETMGDTAAATRTYQQILDDPSARDGSGWTAPATRAAERLSALALDSGDFNAAERWATEATRSAEPTASSWTLLGLANLKKNQTGAAIAAFQNALTLEPDDAIALNNLGNAYFAEGRRDEAIAAFEQAIGVQPDFATAQENLAAARQAPAGRPVPPRQQAVPTQASGIRLEDARAPSLQRPAARVVALDEAARTAGIQQGDLLLRIGGQPVIDARDARRKIEAASGEIRIDLIRAGQPMSVTVVR